MVVDSLCRSIIPLFPDCCQKKKSSGPVRRFQVASNLAVAVAIPSFDSTDFPMIQLSL